MIWTYLDLRNGDAKYLLRQSIYETLNNFISMHHFPSSEKWLTHLPCLCCPGEKHKNCSKCGLDKHLKSTEAKLGSKTAYVRKHIRDCSTNVICWNSTFRFFLHLSGLMNNISDFFTVIHHLNVSFKITKFLTKFCVILQIMWTRKNICK